MTTIADLLPALAEALAHDPAYAGIGVGDLTALPTTGLAHDHVLIGGTGRLLRVPRQSQMRLDARANLVYQAACFERASRSGHAPRCFGTIEPSAALPMGALIVEAIDGPVVTLPADLGAIAEALAAMHALPVPPPGDRPPLADRGDPYRATLTEVRDQAMFLERADISPESRRLIAAEIEAAERHAASLTPPAPITLISFDAHPGNFLKRTADGAAVLVDLEKARYGAAGFDLAHATLYTSTTWDVATYAEPTADAVAGFYADWLAALPPGLADAQRPHLMALRRLMWLWSITWCAKWRVESLATRRADKQAAADTEDWSAENSDAALIDHVRDRTAHYLAPETIARVTADWTGRHALSNLLGRL